MAQENALFYRVCQNGSAGDWYWEVISYRKIIDRGLSSTRVRARAQALQVAASHVVRDAYRGTLKTSTPRSSTTEM
jgi:hypothetical protein